MIKVIGLMKRREGMSTQEFRDYYENHHRLLGEQFVGQFACKYVRKYLSPMADDTYGLEREPAFDCVMELWYPSQAAYDAAMAVLAEPENVKINGEDMERLFNLELCEFLIAEECESVVGSA